jgi:3-oxoacyl-[acyl-carrier protein] reductase
MDLGLEGRVALVAAASKGLGLAIAEELAREGARLMICARGEEALMQARAVIEDRTGAQVLAETADVSSPADVVRLVEACAAALGPVDILVTNAGGPPAGPFESHSPEAWRDAVALNLESTVNLCRAVLPAMKERRWGRILSVTSIAVKQPVENLILSNSVRAAVTGFARTLATEVAPYGVTVNNLMPGYTRTERLEELAARNAQLRGSDPAEERSHWEREIPMGRLGEPREFAALAAFLASERASYITAQSIAVDGGWIRSLL